LPALGALPSRRKARLNVTVTSLSLEALLLLVVVAFFAGLVDAVAGGGGLLTVPALMASGLPPHLVLGTNKGQSVFGAGSALLRFARSGILDPPRALAAVPAALAGSLCGASLVFLLRAEVLRPVVLALLVGAALLTAFRPRPRVCQGRLFPLAKARASVASALIALVVGAYDGFFCPGTGTFLILAFVLVLGDGMTRASGEAKVVNFASNLAAVGLFAARGSILWRVALPMAVGEVAGSALGAHLALRRGDAFVRRVVFCVVLLTALKILLDLVPG
jgi:uncharacterized protein